MSWREYYRPRFSPEQHAAFEAALLTQLKQRGPLLTIELVAALGQPTGTVCWFLQRLLKQGQVWSQKQNHIRLTDRGKQYSKATLWGWINDVALVPETRKPVRAESGITAEDHAWMAYWRQQRLDRQTQREKRRHAL